MLQFEKLLDDYTEAVQEHDQAQEHGTMEAVNRTRLKRDAAKAALIKYHAERMR